MTPGSHDPAAPSKDWIDEHYARIHRAAWMMTGDAWEAEDLAQETFVIAMEKWHRFQGRSSEATWLYGILVRLRRRRGRTLTRMRRAMKTLFESTDRERAESHDPQAALDHQQWQQSIWADVARLPAPQRDAVTLRFAEELSYDEIADALGCAPGTAKSRVHHGIKRLQHLCSETITTDRNPSVQFHIHPS